jgi:hypothetical protein
LLECHAASGHHLQSYWLISYWIDYLGFITEGKLAAIFIKHSLGVSNWLVIYYTFPRQLGNRSFLSPLPRLKKKLHIIITALSTSFLVPFPRKKKTSARGVSHAHPLLCFKFCFTLFLLASFYQKHKKISILGSCFYLSAFSLLEWLLLKTPSCVTLLAQTIVILSALLLRHLLLLQTFMRLSLLY